MHNAAGVIALSAEYHNDEYGVTSLANVTADRVNVTATNFGVDSTTFKLEVINPGGERDGVGGGGGVGWSNERFPWDSLQNPSKTYDRESAVGVIAEPRRVALAAQGASYAGGRATIEHANCKYPKERHEPYDQLCGGDPLRGEISLSASARKNHTHTRGLPRWAAPSRTPREKSSRAYNRGGELGHS